MDSTATRRRFSVEADECIGYAGILHEDEPVELTEGAIVQKSPISVPHRASVKRLNFLITDGLVGRATVSVQEPIHLAGRSRPLPEVVVLQHRSDCYAATHPHRGMCCWWSRWRTPRSPTTVRPSCHSTPLPVSLRHGCQPSPAPDWGVPRSRAERLRFLHLS